MSGFNTSAKASTGAANASSLGLTIPAGVLEGDLLLLWFVSNNDTSGSGTLAGPTVTVPTGWRAITDQGTEVTAGNTRAANGGMLLYTYASATDPGSTVTVNYTTGYGAEMLLLAYTGYVIDKADQRVSNYTPTGTTIVAPGGIPSTAADISLIWASNAGGSGSSVTGITWSAGWTQRDYQNDQIGIHGEYSFVGVAEKLLTSSASMGLISSDDSAWPFSGYAYGSGHVLLQEGSPLELVLSSTNDTLVSTARKLMTTTGTAASPTTLVAKKTGWGEIWSQGNAAAWAGAGAAPAASGHGWILDDTLLEGATFNAGVASNSGNPVFPMTITPRLSLSTGTLSGSLVGRVYKRSSGGVFTLIAQSSALSVSLSTAVASFPLSFQTTGTGWSASSFAAGDTLYLDLVMNITAATSSNSATLLVEENTAIDYFRSSGYLPPAPSAIQPAVPLLVAQSVARSTAW